MDFQKIKSEVYFENIYENITKILLSAKCSVKICVAWISSSRLTDTLTTLRSNNVPVEIIYNMSISNAGLQVIGEGLQGTYAIRAWQGGFMHNKFCIVDNQILITGSFNWTHNADISLENIVVIEGDYRLIKSYLHEFEDLKHYSTLTSKPRPIRPTHTDGSRCRSLVYNIGIFGYHNHSDDSQTKSIWSVCKKHKDARLVRTLKISSTSGDETDLNDSSDDDWHTSRDRMLDQFRLERAIYDAPTKFFLREMDVEVHAYGSVMQDDLAAKHGWNDDPNFFVSLYWRHKYWRKVIPSKLLYEDGNIFKIIKNHRPLSF